MRNRPYDHTRAHPSTTATVSSSSALRTPARSATSMGLNAGGRMAKTGQSSRRRTARGRGRRSNIRGICLGDVARNIDVGFSPAILGRPSQAQAHSVGRASGSTASPSRRPQSGPVKTNQPNAVSAPVKIPEPSYTGEPAAASPCGNKSKAKSKSIPNGPNAQVSIPATTQANDAALAKSAASAAIVEAVHGHWNGNGSLGTTDRNEFVREVLTLIHVRRLPSHLWPFIHVISSPSFRSFLSSSS